MLRLLISLALGSIGAYIIVWALYAICEDPDYFPPDFPKKED